VSKTTPNKHFQGLLKGDTNMQFLLEVYIDVDTIEDAEEIAHDLHEILGDNGITNSVSVIEEEE